MHVSRPDNPELPRITPWIIRKEPGISASEAVRNPFYWAVDTLGNQLPYIDRILFTQKSTDMVTLSAVEGAVSMQNKFIDPAMYTLIMEKSVTESYNVYHWISHDRNSMIVHANQNYRPDKNDQYGLKIKKLLEDVRFRRALSISLDRKALIEGLYDGRTTPANAVPGPDSVFYNPGAFQRWTQFDPAEANRLLDEVGLTGRDLGGFRTLPDGSRLKVILSVTGIAGEAGQLMVDQWGKVGLRIILKIQGERLFISQMQQGDLQLFSWAGYSWLSPLPPLPFANGSSTWFMKGGLVGNPDALKGNAVAPGKGTPIYQYIQAYADAIRHSDLKKVKLNVDQMTSLLADQQWSINVSTPLPALAIVKKGFMNVPKNLTFSWTLQTPGNGGVEAFCFSEKYLSEPGVQSSEKSYLPSIKAQILGPLNGEKLSANKNNVAKSGGGSPIFASMLKWTLVVFFVLILAMAAFRHPYIAKRMTIMVPTLLLISVIIFVVIQLPAGNYITTRIAELQQTGENLNDEQIREFNEMFYLEDPVPVQYLRWMGFKWFTSFSEKDKGLLQGYMGRSMVDQRVVNDVVSERIALTFCISLLTIIFTWCIAIPIGIYSAVRQYSLFDYVVTFLGFIGMCVPGFLLALLLMYFCKAYFGFLPTGLFSQQMGAQPYWDWPKVLDLARHIWVPVVILGVGGTTVMIRVMRANLLDELRKPYVVTARAKGVRPIKMLLKYPVRVALNPFVSTIGGIFPALVSGGAIVAIVLSLPTVGPLLLSSVMNEDMYMAGSLLLSLSLLSMIGILFSDLLLLAFDPRIRYEGKGKQ
jgi:ABC-type dipeptide/oligopeptide/nickel transport system permease component